MKRLILTALLSCIAHADPIRVAVIDTGLDMTWAVKKDDTRLKDHMDQSAPVGGTVPIKVCEDGLYDFVNGSGDGKVPAEKMKDDHGHGTHIAGLIAKFAAGQDYCIVVMKYYDSKGNDMNNLVNTVKAFETAVKLKVDVINYSGGGIAPSIEERTQVLAALDAGIIVVAAAGNERSDINTHRYYPAAYDPRIVVVGSVDRQGKDLPTSNTSKNQKGQIQVEKELGNDVFSTLPGGQYGYMTGTSQATAIMSGGIVNRLAMLRKDKYMKIIFDRTMPKQDIQAPAKCVVPKGKNESNTTRVTCDRVPVSQGR
jgi:subtilisin family serine protease